MIQKNKMNNYLNLKIIDLYKNLDFRISDFQREPESKEYAACRFKLNELNTVSRHAKITPKKVGQFVTFWKRSGDATITPFEEQDDFDLFVVTVKVDNELGQFIFPKSILIKKGIISTNQKEGKRAFRVYPSWDLPQSKQALQSQKWQLEYFCKIEESTENSRFSNLYSIK